MLHWMFCCTQLQSVPTCIARERLMTPFIIACTSMEDLHYWIWVYPSHFYCGSVALSIQSLVFLSFWTPLGSFSTRASCFVTVKTASWLYTLPVDCVLCQLTVYYASWLCTVPVDCVLCQLTVYSASWLYTMPCSWLYTLPVDSVLCIVKFPSGVPCACFDFMLTV